jgi:hypothetical protein
MNCCPTTNRRLKPRVQVAESGILDDPADHEVDLAWLTCQISKSACDTNRSLKKTIPDLPDVVFSTKPLSAVRAKPPGAPGSHPASDVMVYVHRRRQRRPGLGG